LRGGGGRSKKLQMEDDFYKWEGNPKLPDGVHIRRQDSWEKGGKRKKSERAGRGGLLESWVGKKN